MIREFIFADDKKAITKRWRAFWILSYILLSFNNLPSIRAIPEFYELKSYKDIFITTSFWYLLTICSVLLFSKFIIPRYLITKQYKLLLFTCGLGWAAIFLVAMAMSYLDNYILSAIQCNCADSGSIINTFFLAIYYTLVINIPLSIFLMAYHFMKAYHKEQIIQTILLREKTEHEMNIQRNKLHPEYFLNSIKALSIQSINSAASQSTLVLLFSNVLSYMLYETNAITIDIDKEIDITQDLIDFENILYNRDIVLHINKSHPDTIVLIKPLQLLNPLINLFLNREAKSGHSTGLEFTVGTPACQVAISLDRNNIPSNKYVYPWISLNQSKTGL